MQSLDNQSDNETVKNNVSIMKFTIFDWEEYIKINMLQKLFNKIMQIIFFGSYLRLQRFINRKHLFLKNRVYNNFL